MPSAEQRTADIVALAGGVMTDEAGVVTGELTLRSDLSDGTYVLMVQYQGAAEWYHVTGTKTRLRSKHDLDAMHAQAVALLHRPEA
jgi:hypothetical protein